MDDIKKDVINSSKVSFYRRFMNSVKLDRYTKISITISIAIILCILAYAFLPFNEMSFIYNEF
ncbi:MAG: hypothetical protein SPG13_04330 [Peptostreptococcus porci]|uniref:hypothetical protein n=1 Tax=Peptostreptococcus porci TaxID=2652282 RepID=UPI002A7661B4|nr:hypothetical protein [Peptostreptococcus porci]MDY2794056.1 hypothetical protein [Peptostreptococcus porci]MDY5479668.1 hypothetical protein [Peptostreptococcus porci]